MSKQANVPTAPVTARVVVPGSPDRAFELFTQHFAEWWPLAKFGVFRDAAASCAIEPREGGRIYETSKDGKESDWGKVLSWNEGTEFKCSWHPGSPESQAQELLVKFKEMMFGTTVEIEHGNWEPLGAGAKAAKERYEKGWPVVLDAFAKRAQKL